MRIHPTRLALATTSALFLSCTPPLESGGVDSGSPVDAGAADAGPIDSGSPADAGAADAGPSDAGSTDSGVADAGLTLATVRLPFAKLNAAYAATLFVSPTGSPPYTWSMSGLPGGLIASSGGVISGSPTALGTFSVGVVVTDSSSPPLRGNASLTLIVYDGSLAGAIDQSFFGVNVHDTLGNTDVLPLVGVDQNPFSVIRLWDTRTMWLDLEPSEGHFDFQKQDASMDGFLAYAQANGLTVLYDVGQTPGWASSDAGDSSCKYALGSCDAPTDWNSGDTFFTNYLTTLIGRYNSSATAAHPQTGCPSTDPQCHGAIGMYELWNEPSVHSEWNPTQPFQAFVRLNDDAYDTIHGTDANAQVISPSGYLPWMDTTYWANGGIMGTGNTGRKFDLIAIHQYSAYGSNASFVPEQMVREQADWKRALSKYGIDVPTADTEGGMGPHEGNLATEAEKGDYVARYILLNAGLKNRFAVWYTWQGLWDAQAGHLRMTGQAYHNVGNWLLGAKVTSAGCLDANGVLGGFDTCAAMGGNNTATYVMNLKKPSGTAQAVWYLAFATGNANWNATTAYPVPAQFAACQKANDGSACLATGTALIGAEPSLFMTAGYALP